uniref:Uncharacterized protein n=1 Tax=Mesocestoides corti TaxID=53468 RepID=A0A5K3FA04_MESCO
MCLKFTSTNLPHLKAAHSSDFLCQIVDILRSCGDRSWVFANSKLARKAVEMDDMCHRYERVTSVLRQALNAILSNPDRPRNCLVSQLVDNEEGELTRESRLLSIIDKND